jgi:hypothetical protein
MAIRGSNAHIKFYFIIVDRNMTPISHNITRKRAKFGQKKVPIPYTLYVFADMTAGSATAQLNQISSLPAQQGAEAEDSEFDMFAQARNVTYESSKKG